MECFLASDLHGKERRYQALFGAIRDEKPDAVFLGGDLLPGGSLRRGGGADKDFIDGFLATDLERLQSALGERYPRVFVILGNDDPRSAEPALMRLAGRGLVEYLHGRRAELGGHPVLGYACVPPTPFLLKDWERWDVSRHLEPGSVSPEDGVRTVAVPPNEIRFATIARDLAALAGDAPLDRAVMLFHSPAYDTALDRAALDGASVEHVPLDVHVGSIAIRRFIEDRQPLVTLHGHIHESARLTGSWRDTIGRTVMLSAAHDGPELALVRFDLDEPGAATRELV